MRLHFKWLFLGLASLLVSCCVVVESFTCNGDCDPLLCPPVNCSLGIYMDDPNIPCSCCQICISYIDEDEPCTKFSTRKFCGPGLTCNADGLCVKLETECLQRQREYDDQVTQGVAWMFLARPNCDEDGQYVGRHCAPSSSCYCVDKQKKTIFGEAPPSQAIDNVQMNCDCSRQYADVIEAGLDGLRFPHCLPNGNYDTLQCIGLACFCINWQVQTTSNSVPITAIMDLPCYDPKWHTPKYYRVCEVERMERQAVLDAYARQNITVVGLEMPNCTPDGFYAPVRKIDDTAYCVDPWGNPIESFQLDSSDPGFNYMNCRCARSRFWLSEETIASPSCCTNGSFRLIQCRNGFCYCVNPETGDQVGLETRQSNIESLSCYGQYEPRC